MKDLLDNNGEAISVTDANDIIQKYKDINGNVGSVIEKAIAKKRKESKAFFKGIKLNNTFVFDGSLIKRFFEGGNEAEFVIVCIGAQVKEETGKEIGEPTVVVAGCKKDGDNFVTLNIEKPVSEHPPKASITKIIDGGKQLSFSFV